MLRTIATTALLLSLAACGGGEDEDPRLVKVKEEAPSVLEVYSEKETVALMDEVCESQDLDTDIPDGIDPGDWGYVQGLALSACKE